MKSAEEKKTAEQTPETVGKTETFFSRNVRAVTFLIVLGLFLAFFGPFSVFTIGRMIERRVNRKNTLTVEETLKLAENPSAITFERLRKYNGRYNETDTVEVYYIEFDHYLILATRNKTTGALTALIENLDNGVRINLQKDDVRAFFDGTMQPEREEENAA